jgi:hypothetical protein
MTRGGIAAVLFGGDVGEGVSVGLPRGSAAKGVGVGMLTPADVAGELRITLSDKGVAEGVGVAVAFELGPSCADFCGQSNIRP